jgi:hypothetical protein
VGAATLASAALSCEGLVGSFSVHEGGAGSMTGSGLEGGGAGSGDADSGGAGGGSADDACSGERWSSDFSDADGWKSHASYWETIRFPDVNGDGYADVCGRAKDGMRCGLSSLCSFGKTTSYSSGFSDADGWKSNEFYWRTIQFPDLNGDKKADVCGRFADGIFCGLSNGAKFETISKWTESFSDATAWNLYPSYWQTIRFPDVNGDGKADVCGRYEDGIYCGLSDGVKFEQVSLWSGDYGNTYEWTNQTSYWQSIQFPDVNGDSKADVCGRYEDGLRCGVSNGTKFETTSIWSSSYSDLVGWDANPSIWQTIRFPDLNGDGMADVCGRGIYGLVCKLSDKEQFVTTSTIYWNVNFSDDNGFASGDSYWQTIQYGDINQDGRADVCGRRYNGIHCSTSNGNVFVEYDLWWFSFRDDSGWGSDPSHWRTIQFNSCPDTTRLCGRGSDGIYCVVSDGTPLD